MAHIREGSLGNSWNLAVQCRVSTWQNISKFHKNEEELVVMGDIIPDKDIVMLQISSLTESWDTFTAAFIGSHGSQFLVISHELITIHLDKHCWCTTHSADSAMTACHLNRGKSNNNSNSNNDWRSVITCTSPRDLLGIWCWQSRTRATLK